MSNLVVDSEILELLKKFQGEGETIIDVLRRLLYKEIKNISEPLQSVTISDEQWDEAAKLVLHDYHNVLEKLAK